MTASPRHCDSAFEQLANDPAQTGAEGRVDGDVDDGLCVSRPLTTCHALPLRLLSFNATKFLGISLARRTDGHVFEERRVGRWNLSEWNLSEWNLSEWNLSEWNLSDSIF